MRAFFCQQPHKPGFGGPADCPGEHLSGLFGAALKCQGLAINQQDLHQMTVVGVTLGWLKEGAENFLGPFRLIQGQHYPRLTDPVLFKVQGVGELGIRP